MIVPVRDPENHSFEELVAVYQELGPDKTQAEAHAGLLKDPPPDLIA